MGLFKQMKDMKDEMLPWPWNEPWIDLGGEG